MNSRTAPCPHCGKPNAPVGGGFIDRHRRADWVPDVSPSNEICGVGPFMVRPGERCHHLIPDPHCTEYRDGEDGPDTYSWDEGVAP